MSCIRTSVLILLLLLVLLLSGCQARIQHGLDERQASELQTVLAERGISATKVSEEGKKPTWALEVPEGHASDAVRVLSELGLPRPKVEGFTEVFGKGSLVPTPSEERALYLQALSGELSKTLESLDGVVSARVHLVLPPAPRPGLSPTPSKAAAILRIRPGMLEPISSQKAELAALIAGSVEGLESNQVALMIHEVTTSIAPATRGPASAFIRLRAVLAGMGALVVILSLGLIWTVVRLRQAASRPSVSAATSVPIPILQSKPVLTPAASRKVA